MDDIVQKRYIWPELSDLIRGFTHNLHPADYQLIQTWIAGRMDGMEDVSERHPSKDGEFVCVSTAKATNIMAAYGGKIRDEGFQAATRALRLLKKYIKKGVVQEDEAVIGRMRFVFENLQNMTAPVKVPPVE